MNIFYAKPEHIVGQRLELTGQEARHAAKTLRYKRGDKITAVDGQGGWFEGHVTQITEKKVVVKIELREQKEIPSPKVTLAVGIIKKRDRLEFAVEKAVELGVSEIAVFRGEQSVKKNVRKDRLEAQVLAAMKQSLQAYLPAVNIFNSLDELLAHYADEEVLVAHQEGEALKKTADISLQTDSYLLITGPEGDFSNKELQLLKKKNIPLMSLGQNRLRTETAAIIFLNNFLFIQS